jgi:hypothetical protein
VGERKFGASGPEQALTLSSHRRFGGELPGKQRLGGRQFAQRHPGRGEAPGDRSDPVRGLNFHGNRQNPFQLVSFLLGLELHAKEARQPPTRLYQPLPMIELLGDGDTLLKHRPRGAELASRGPRLANQSQ